MNVYNVIPLFFNHYFILFLFLLSGCLNLNNGSNYLEEKQKLLMAIIIYDYEKIPENLKFKILGKVHGYCASKNGIDKNLANLDMKRDAIEKYGTNVDAIISTQCSYYGGFYGKGGTNAFGQAIEILHE